MIKEAVDLNTPPHPLGDTGKPKYGERKGTNGALRQQKCLPYSRLL